MGGQCSEEEPPVGFVRIEAVTLRPALLAALACAAVLSGCLGDDGEPGAGQPIRGHLLHLYASRPTEGTSAATGRAVAAGQRQALADAGARAGRYRVRLISLSASKPGSGNWDPGQVSENADRAASDPRAIAYIGELNLGASAVSVPVTNKAGLLQVSPADGLASLTEEPPRSAAGPERYFPSGRRSFLRLVPDDLVEARLIVDRMEALGVERPALIVGTGVYARELAAEVVAEARKAGIAPVADGGPARRPRHRARRGAASWPTPRRTPSPTPSCWPWPATATPAQLLAGLRPRAPAGAPADRRRRAGRPAARGRGGVGARSAGGGRAAAAARAAARGSRRVLRPDRARAGRRARHPGRPVGLRVGARRARRDPLRAAQRAGRPTGQT